jgi:hypothetical protein
MAQQQSAQMTKAQLGVLLFGVALIFLGVMWWMVLR